jgi:hypothetical protein
VKGESPTVRLVARKLEDLPFAGEEWRECSVNPKYQVSNFGRVRRISPGVNTYPGRVLRPCPTGDGILAVAFWDNRDSHAVSHLVMAAFGPPRPKGDYYIAHVDSDHSNNRADNLEWRVSVEMPGRFRYGGLRRGEAGGGIGQNGVM